MTLLTVVGFWPTYFQPLVAGTLALDSVLHIHAVVFLGWMLLLVAQAALAFVHRVDLHRKLGLMGAVYGVVVLGVGAWVTVDRFLVTLAGGEIRAAHRGLVVPLFDLVLFAAFFGASMHYRKQPETHKRLVIVATLVLLGPAVARMPFIASIPEIFTVLLSPILFGMAFDLVTRRRIHGVYWIAIAAFLGSGVRLPLRESETWFTFSKWMTGLFS